MHAQYNRRQMLLSAGTGFGGLALAAMLDDRLLADIGSYTGGTYGNRSRIPGYGR